MGYREEFYKNYYQTQGSKYDTGSLEEKIAAAQSIYKREVLQYLNDKSASILELGCGHGALLLLLADLGYEHVAGIDVSEEQVALAKEQGLNNVKQTSIDSFLTGSDEKFDVIIGIDLIEHFTKDELVTLLQLIRNSLKPNGVVIFRTPNCDAPFGSTYSFGDFTHEVHLNFLSAQQLMLGTGFHDVEILPSYIEVGGFLKNLIRKIIWLEVIILSRLILFASGKSSKNVLLTPNMIIKATGA